MAVPFRYIPVRTLPPDRRGYSERIIKRMLERDEWTVWRGDLVGIHEDEVYPNVQRKYALLSALLEQHRPGAAEELEYIAAVHHGIPDFICYRRGLFKFVECKLAHEQLSDRQKACIARLQEMGFLVEVHKIVEESTKTRRAEVDLRTGEKKVVEKQARLKKRWRKPQ